MLSGLGSGETCCYWNRTWTWEDWWISEHKSVGHNEKWLCNEIVDTTRSWIAKCVICCRMGSEFCIGFVNLVDIPVDVAMLLRFLASARRGHLHRAFHIFADLKWYNNWLSMVFDEAELSLTCFWLCDWSEYDSGVCNAAVSPGAPDVRSNWFWWIAMLTQTMWVGVIQGWIKLKIWFTNWIWIHGCKGCSFVN